MESIRLRQTSVLSSSSTLSRIALQISKQSVQIKIHLGPAMRSLAGLLGFPQKEQKGSTVRGMGAACSLVCADFVEVLGLGFVVLPLDMGFSVFCADLAIKKVYKIFL